MKAIIKTAQAPESVAWLDWPDPLPGHGQVVVEIERAGICSTDVAIYDWTYRGRQPVPIPSVLGHEGAGHVTEIGNGVVDIAVGDRVALQVIWVIRRRPSRCAARRISIPIGAISGPQNSVASLPSA